MKQGVASQISGIEMIFLHLGYFSETVHRKSAEIHPMNTLHISSTHVKISKYHLHNVSSYKINTHLTSRIIFILILNSKSAITVWHTNFNPCIQKISHHSWISTQEDSVMKVHFLSLQAQLVSNSKCDHGFVFEIAHLFHHP
ncbi:Protein of unknown function, partial [Cotesia congregata]